MKFFKQKDRKEPLPVFLVKGSLLVGAMYLAGSAFFSRYSIAIDPQVVRCIPGYSVYLLDHKDTKPERDGLFAFRSKDLSPIYPEGQEMLKYLRALPGDEVSIQISGQIFVNQKPVAFGLTLAEEKLGRKKTDFVGRTKLPENNYWFMGTSHLSFDSRYWGGVQRENIYARAYPIF